MNIVSIFHGTPNATYGVEILDSSFTVLQARTTSGVTEYSRSGTHTGVYRWSGTVSDRTLYVAVWDRGDGNFGAGLIDATTASAGGLVGASPGVLTLDDDTPITTFTIKRNDTLPVFAAKLRYEDGSIPVIDAGLDTIKLNMRLQSGSVNDFTSGTAKVHATMDVVDEADAHVSYSWIEADTNTAGAYYLEVEVNHDDGTIETFPQSGYVRVTIVPDLDPGVDP